MSKSKLSVASGKHRKYTCECGIVVSVGLPISKASHKCGACGEDLRGCKYTVEDLSVRRRDAEGKR